MRAGWIALALVVIVAAGGYALLRSGRTPAPIAKTLHEVASSVASSAAAVASAYEPTDAPDASADASEVWVRQNGPPFEHAARGPAGAPGTFVTECGAPDTMHVTIKVNVKFGRATSVDVKTTPPDKTIAACIDRAIRDKHWDVSPRPGHVSVTY